MGTVGHDVLTGGEVVADEVLEEDAEVGAEVVEGELAEVGAVDEHLPLVGVVEAQQELYQGALTEAVAAVDAGDFAPSGGEGKMLEHIALHVGVAEGDVAELHLLHAPGEGYGAGGREDGGLQVEELEEVAHEEAVVVEAGHAAHEGREVALAAAESLEEHDEGADGDGGGEGLLQQQPDDGEHGGGLDEATGDVERTQAARDGQQAAYQMLARIHETHAEERRQAQRAEFLGEVAAGEQGAVVGGAAVELGVVAAEAVDAARLVEPHTESRQHGRNHHHDDPPRGGDQHGHHTGDGEQRAAEGHEVGKHLQRAEGGLLLGTVEGVVVGGGVVVLHVEPRRLVLEQVADVVDEALSEDVVVDAAERVDYTVEQEDTAHGEEKVERGELKTEGSELETGLLDTVYEELEDVEVDQRQQALDRYVEDTQPEGARAATPDHHEGTPEVFHFSYI